MGKAEFIGAEKLDLKKSATVAAALERLGRTEDLKFSADGKHLVIVGYNNNRLLILRLRSTKTSAISAFDYLEITSAHLKKPHGVFWIDDFTLIIANREGDVCVLSLPLKWPASRAVDLSPVAVIDQSTFPPLSSPGSVSVREFAKRQYEILICNNYVNMISCHELDLRKAAVVKNHKCYLDAELDVPDGVIHSNTGRFVAVSNHNKKSVYIYEQASVLVQESLPSGQLLGLSYPHGLAFSSTEKFMFIADAAEPFVHVYCDRKKQWQGEHYPIAAIRVMNDETFIRGHINPEEGGPKGIALNHDDTLLAVTCEEEPLVFYDVSTIIKAKSFPPFEKPMLPDSPAPLASPPRGFFARLFGLR